MMPAAAIPKAAAIALLIAAALPAAAQVAEPAQDAARVPPAGESTPAAAPNLAYRKFPAEFADYYITRRLTGRATEPRPFCKSSRPLLVDGGGSPLRMQAILDESGGTGTGYDTLYVDTGDGEFASPAAYKVAPSDRKTGLGGRPLLSYFDAVSVRARDSDGATQAQVFLEHDPTGVAGSDYVLNLVPAQWAVGTIQVGGQPVPVAMIDGTWNGSVTDRRGADLERINQMAPGDDAEAVHGDYLVIGRPGETQLQPGDANGWLGQGGSARALDTQYLVLDSGTYEVRARAAEGGVNLELAPASVPMATVHLNQVPHTDRLAMFGANTCVVLDNPATTIQVPEDTYYIPAFGSYTASVPAGSNTMLPAPTDVDATSQQAYNPLPDRAERIFAAEPPAGIAWSQPQADPFAFSRSSWRTMDLQVVTGEARRVVAGAKVEVYCHTGGWYSGKGGRRDLATDSAGRCTIRVPGAGLQYVTVQVSAAGLVPASMGWDVERGTPLPQRYTWLAERGITIGGTVRDERDRPIRNVQVLISNDNVGFAADKPQAALWSLQVRTDTRGRWETDGIPAGDPLRFQLLHPDYISDESPVHNAPIQQLREQSAVFVMKQGITLEGKVLGPHGEPIKGATANFRYWDDSNPSRTDGSGRFRVRNLKPGEIRLLVKAEGCAPELKKIDVQPNPRPVEFKLQAARTFKGRVVDENGQPIPQAQVTLVQWRGGRDLDWRAKTDLQGRVRWDEAPVDAFWLSVFAEGREDGWVNDAVAGPEERVIVLKRKMTITGRVTDAATGGLVGTFKAMMGHDWGDGLARWSRYDPAPGKDGMFTLQAERPSRQFWVRVEAQGYLPCICPALDDLPSEPLEFALVRGEDLAGVVVGLDGRPLADVQVALASAAEPVRVQDGRVNRDFGAVVATTDAEGRFRLPPQIDTYTLLAVHKEGFASARQAVFEKSHRMKLEPWGRLEGLACRGSRIMDTRQIVFHTTGRLADRDFPAGFYYRAVSDEAGRFAVERMVPGIHSVEWTQEDSNGKSLRCFRTIQVKPGQTCRLDFDEAGRAVTGHLRVSAAPGRKILWEQTYLSIQRVRPSPKVPTSLPAGSQALQTWYDGWLRGEKGLQYRLAGRSYRPSVGEDGTFETCNVPPGRYVLFANAWEKEDQKLESVCIGTTLQEFEVRGGEGESPSPLDLGTITFKPSRPIKAGQPAPAIACKTADGKSFNLGQYRGKYLLLGFWAAWDDAPYRIERLKYIHRLYGQDDRLAIVGLSVDPQPEDAKNFAALNAMPWPQAHLGIEAGAATLGEYGITWLPEEVLIAPDGRIIGGGPMNIDIRAELVKALGKPAATQPATTQLGGAPSPATRPAATTHVVDR